MLLLDIRLATSPLSFITSQLLGKNGFVSYIVQKGYLRRVQLEIVS